LGPCIIIECVWKTGSTTPDICWDRTSPEIERLALLGRSLVGAFGMISPSAPRSIARGEHQRAGDIPTTMMRENTHTHTHTHIR